MTPQRVERVMQTIGALQAANGDAVEPPKFSHQEWCKCFSSPRATLRACMCEPKLFIGGLPYRVNARTGELERTW